MAKPVIKGTAKRYRVTALTYRRLTPNRRLDSVVAVGDKITVLASSANTDKTYTVRSFVHDGLWGDGQGPIWQSKAGSSSNAAGKNSKWLGADSSGGAFDLAAAGTGETDFALTLDKSVDYAAYGDYVPFAKVYPAPVNDMVVTEIQAEGTNSTHFTRIVEDVSTSINEIATLRLYAPRRAGLHVDASQLQGNFQLAYNGVESANIPVSSSANQLMDALSAMSTISHTPVVTKYQTLSGTSWTSSAVAKKASYREAVGSSVENVRAGSTFVEWQITFTSQTADASKLTFKYVGTTGDERLHSALTDGHGNVLGNSWQYIQDYGLARMTYIDTDIVMQYSHGSTFFATIDEEASTDWSSGQTEDAHADDRETELDNVAAVHDELAMDVVPGSTMTVSSAEDIYLYFYQRVAAGHTANQDGTNAQADFFTAECVKDTTSDSDIATPDGDFSRNPTISFEYDGVFSVPVGLCKEHEEKQAAALTKAIEAVQSLPGLGSTDAYGGATVVGSKTESTAATEWTASAGAAVDSSFASNFDWHQTTANVHADFRPKATDMIKVTLPLGADGAKFRIHFHAGFGATAAIDEGSAFKTFQYRARNNNGRTFTVTKAYENKVTDLYSVTRAKALSQATDRTSAGTYSGAAEPNSPNPEDASGALGAGALAAGGGGSLRGNIMHLLEPDHASNG